MGKRAVAIGSEPLPHFEILEDGKVVAECWDLGEARRIAGVPELEAQLDALRKTLDRLHGWMTRHMAAGGEGPPTELMDLALSTLAKVTP